MTNDTTTAKQRYEQLARQRQPFLDRARDCAALTIPALLPQEGFNSSSDLPNPYQSLGARGVNNLSSKMMLTLLPPSASFFRFAMEPSIEEQLDEKGKTAFDLALSKAEQAVLGEIEKRSVRTSAVEQFKHEIVTGNCLVQYSEDRSTRVFPLTQYVVKRDTAGNVLEIIIKEVISALALKKEFREQIKEHLQNDGRAKESDEIDVYTRICLEDDKTYYIHQEVFGIEVPGTEGEYPKDKLPWIPYRWRIVDGQDYGRSYVEEYLGDLQSYNALNKSVVEAAAITARLLWLVNPNSVVDEDDVVSKPNGSSIPGVEGDVVALQADKRADLQVSMTMIENLEKRLSHAFLLNSSIQRSGERVTAEEIRYMATELENTLGGVYSTMSTQFQLPLVQLMMAQMSKAGLLPELPKDAVTPTIVTGLDALGRTHQLARLDTFVDGASERFGPEVVARSIHMDEYMNRRAAALGIDPKGLIKTPEEMQAEQTQASNQALTEKLGPQVIKGMSDSVNMQQQQATDV
jgi:hypothetical protein